MYKITQWVKIDEKIASINHGFVVIGIVSKEDSSEIALHALNISITTNTVKDSVTGFRFPVVKYKQAFLVKSNPLKLFTVKSVHFSQSDQVVSLLHSIRLWPSVCSK